MAGALLVIVCNVNRGNLVPLRGVPWVIPLVLLLVVAWTLFLGKTRTGRYMYAIGASPEAARRAGIRVQWIRTVAFTLSAFTAGLGGLVFASRLGSISVGYDGSTYVLYAIAAAVIGGASLFGGYGKAGARPARRRPHRRRGQRPGPHRGQHGRERRSPPPWCCSPRSPSTRIVRRRGSTT